LETHRKALAGDAILHPVALACIALLLLNDHYLKSAYPGTITGKLSDVAGLVFFPLLLAGLWEVALLAIRRWEGRPRRRVVVVAVVITGIGFALVKTTQPAAEAFSDALGFGQWLPAALASAITAHPVVGLPVVTRIVVDPGDLIALPALLVTLAIGLRRAGWQPRQGSAG
jgi:hypothetical protein